MKRLRMIVAAILITLLIEGCGLFHVMDGDGMERSDYQIFEEEEKSASDSVESGMETESEPEETEKETTEEQNQQTEAKKESHYQYNVKAISSFVLDSGHDNIETYWGDFQDAVMEGRTSFLCPDVSVYRYIQMELVPWYLPGADEWIQFSDKVKLSDGMASFSYAISDEERIEKLEQIKIETEKVLNEVLEDDYTDFEKALALYLYFVNNYTYVDDLDNWGGIMHVLTMHCGICDEFARTYSYLLVQAGVEAGTISNFGHKWSFIKIKDHYYHVDTTWGLGYNNLSYFMMSTSQRLATTGDTRDQLCMELVQEYQYAENDYPDEDNYFAPFWNSISEFTWDRNAQKIYVKEPYYENGRELWKIREVSYAGY